MAIRRLEDDERDVVAANLGLVATFIPRRIREDPGRFDDAFQEGCLALIAAVERCDASRGALSTLAGRCIGNAIKNMEADDTMIHVPRYHRWKIAALRGSIERHGASAAVAMREPTSFAVFQGGRPDIAAPPREGPPDALLEALRDAVAALPGREGKVVRDRLEGRLFREIGRDLGITVERTRQLWASGAEMLKAALADHDY